MSTSLRAVIQGSAFFIGVAETVRRVFFRGVVQVILYSAELPIELNNGNDGRGGRWFSSAKVRKQIEATLRALKLTRPKPFSGPVSLMITRMLGARQQKWDADSYQRGNLKELIDALVVCGWFVDDGPKYIEEVRFKQLDLKPRPVKSTTLIEVMSNE